MSAKEHELSGDDWVLMNFSTCDCVLKDEDHLMAFESNSDAETFRQRNGLANFSAVQVKTMRKH